MPFNTLRNRICAAGVPAEQGEGNALVSILGGKREFVGLVGYQTPERDHGIDQEAGPGVDCAMSMRGAYSRIVKGGGDSCGGRFQAFGLTETDTKSGGPDQLGDAVDRDRQESAVACSARRTQTTPTA